MTSLETFSLNRASPAMSHANPWYSLLIPCPYAYTRPWLGSAQAKALMWGAQRANAPRWAIAGRLQDA
jgi:hypothetical protein